MRGAVAKRLRKAAKVKGSQSTYEDKVVKKVPRVDAKGKVTVKESVQRTLGDCPRKVYLMLKAIYKEDK